MYLKTPLKIVILYKNNCYFETVLTEIRGAEFVLGMWEITHTAVSGPHTENGQKHQEKEVVLLHLLLYRNKSSLYIKWVIYIERDVH